MSVRLLLGREPPEVIGQLLVEGLGLGLSGERGLLLSPLLAKALIALITPISATGETSPLSATPDRSVVLFCFLVSVFASILFSLAPIVQFYRPKVTAALKQQTGTGEIEHARFRRVTVGVQIALSLMLLVGAGLFSHTLSNLKSVDVGFVTDHLLTFQLDPRLAGYRPSAVAALYERLLNTLSTQPGVQSVGMTTDPGGATGNATFSIDVPGYQFQEGERHSFEWEHVTPAYFSTLRLRLLAGRDFTDGDTPTSSKVVIVNESFVRKFFGTAEQALGKTFTVGKTNQALSIVGVVKDAKHSSVHDAFAPIFYTPIFQDAEPGSVAVYLRTQQAPEGAASAVRMAVAQIDSRLVIDNLQSLNSGIDLTLTSERMLSFLASSFGCVAAFITAIGLYGVLAYSIAQRTREIGVRMALGATRGAVVKLVLREVVIITGCSVAVAVPLSIGLSSFVKNQLYGISYSDTWTLIFVVLAIGVVALLAASLPARRAVQVQPITALRYE
jgi:predicted permease